MADGAAPEGWYPDPADGSHERWWDGHQWTGARRPAPAGTADPTAPATAAGTAPPGRSRQALAVGALIAVIALGAVALVATLGSEDPEDGLATDETDLPTPTVPGTTEPGPAPESGPAPQGAPPGGDQDAAPDPELPGMTDAVVHRPTDWIAFGELPGDWRYADFFAEDVDPGASDVFGDTEFGRIELSAGHLDEFDVDDFAQFVDMTNEEGLQDMATLEGPRPVTLHGGLDGVQWWGQAPDVPSGMQFQGGLHFGALAVDLGEQLVGVAVAYDEAGPGVAGAPTRDQVDAWMRTIRIDPAAVRAALQAP